MVVNKVEDYKIENVITFRGKISGNEANIILGSALTKIGEEGLALNGPIISATHSIENDCGNQIFDFEFIIPINGVMESADGFVYKDRFEIDNALMFRHIGNPQTMDSEMQEFSRYMQENNLKPVTPFYNATVKTAQSPNDVDEVIIEVYVGLEQ